MTWRPVLAGTPHEEEGRRAVASIAERLANELSPMGGGLVDGGAGIALFMGRLSRAIPAYRHLDEIAGALIEAGASWLVERSPDCGLFHGFTGLGFVADHLRRLAGDVDLELNRELDDAILERPPAHFDLVVGLVGVGVYALERIECASASDVLAMVIELLVAHAASPAGLYTPPEQLGSELREAYPHGYVDLGLAHGLPGVISFLARCAAIDHPRAGDARELLASLVPQLLEHRRGDALATEFPARVARDRPVVPARSAWCYGDASIALALARASRVGDPEWLDVAVAIGRRAAVRPPDETNILDGTLCHGAAGFAHVLARLYAATGDEVVGVAARDWMIRTLEARHGDVFYVATEVGPQPADRFFLQGIAGIGLVLLSAISEIEPDWDRVLLLS